MLMVLLFRSKHFSSLPQEPFSSPTSSLLLAPGLLLLTSEAAARSSSPLLAGFYCATASWKATQLIECQMWCRPVSWALKLRGRAWIRGKVLRSDHRKSAPAGTWMRNKFAPQKLIYLCFFFFFIKKKRNISLLGHFWDNAIDIHTTEQVTAVQLAKPSTKKKTGERSSWLVRIETWSALKLLPVCRDDYTLLHALLHRSEDPSIDCTQLAEGSSHLEHVYFPPHPIMQMAHYGLGRLLPSRLFDHRIAED